MRQEAIMNVFHKGSTLDGTMRINGSIRIDGKLRGDIDATEAVIVGETGVIEGNIKAKEINISGKFTGKIVAENCVVLHATAEINGDIKCKKLVVDEGVVIDGNITMREKDRSAQGEKRKE
ncbi:MAG: polymer-forming cytoskeletal protein [candidate division WOR-3 bacterium]